MESFWTLFGATVVTRCQICQDVGKDNYTASSARSQDLKKQECPLLNNATSVKVETRVPIQNYQQGPREWRTNCEWRRE